MVTKLTRAGSCCLTRIGSISTVCGYTPSLRNQDASRVLATESSAKPWL